MSRNSANVPNCPRHGHPAPTHSHRKRCRWRRWAWRTVCCCCCVSFYIIFCYFAMRSKCGFYVFVYGKIRQMAFTPLSLPFSLSRALAKVPKVTIMKFTHHLPRQGCLSASNHFQLVRISFSDFQLAFLPRPISRSPLLLFYFTCFVEFWSPTGVAYEPQLIRTSCPVPPSEVEFIINTLVPAN